MLHVYLVTPQYPPRPGSGTSISAVGGLFTHAHELFTGLDRAGCAAVVFTPALDTPTDVDGRIHRVAPSAHTMGLPQPVPGVPSADQLASYAEDLLAHVAAASSHTGGPPAVIHCHDFFLFPACAALRAQHGAPVVLTMHLPRAFDAIWGEDVPSELVELERAACREADAIIAVSSSLADALHTSTGVPRERIFVVPNGFDPAPFAPPSDRAAIARDRARLELAPTDRVVLYAGRLTGQKGIVALVESAAQVLAEEPHALFLLAGDGIGDNDLREVHAVERFLAARPAVAARVRRLGDVPRAELPRLYHVAELAVVPSLYEPFGYAAVEAMAAEVPVVATATGGLAEIIEHERTGLLVPIDRSALPHRVDVAALAQAQLRLLGDPGLRSQLGRAGRARVLETYGLDQMVRATLAVYERVANRA